MGRLVSQEIDLSVVAGGTEELLLFYTSRLIRAKDIGYYVTEGPISGGTGFDVDIGLSGGATILSNSTQTTPTAANASKSLVTNVDINPVSFVTCRVENNSRTAGKIAFYVELDND